MCFRGTSPPFCCLDFCSTQCLALPVPWQGCLDPEISSGAPRSAENIVDHSSICPLLGLRHKPCVAPGAKKLGAAQPLHPIRHDDDYPGEVGVMLLGAVHGFRSAHSAARVADVASGGVLPPLGSLWRS